MKIFIFLCGAPFIPALWLSKINSILCKGHITATQLFETVAHRSINQNTCTYIYIYIYHPTFYNQINMINASFPKCIIEVIHTVYTRV